MQRKADSSKFYHFNNWLLLAKLLSLLIFVYISFFCFSCRQVPPKQDLAVQGPTQTSESALNINTATAAELEKLPRIGAEMARRIVEYREKNGSFQRTEDLILVHGMSDTKFREIRSLVKVE